MGLDLKLLPFDADLPHIAYSHTILSCCRRQELFEKIMKIEREKGQLVPDNFNSYSGKHLEHCEETGYGRTTKTPYGEALKFITASDLLVVARDIEVLNNPTNRAIWAYLAHSSPENKVALYWH